MWKWLLAISLCSGFILKSELSNANEEAALKKRAVQALRQREWDYIRHEEAEIRADENRLSGISAHKRRSAEERAEAEAARINYVQRRLRDSRVPEETAAYKEYLAQQERAEKEREQARARYARIREALRTAVESERIISEKELLGLE